MIASLNPGDIERSQPAEIYRKGHAAKLIESVCDLVEAAAKIVEAVAKGAAPVYGINTGFGKLASVKINSGDTARLQRNLILSHCCGMGELLEPNTTRLMMVLKLLSLARGASGVRWQTIRQIDAMLGKNILPVIPCQGSVGASGDLVPQTYMAPAMAGEAKPLLTAAGWQVPKRLPARG